jgi:hypothetical protein
VSKNKRTGFKVLRDRHRESGCRGPCVMCDGFKVDRTLLSALDQEREHRMDSAPDPLPEPETT